MKRGVVLFELIVVAGLVLATGCGSRSSGVSTREADAEKFSVARIGAARAELKVRAQQAVDRESVPARAIGQLPNFRQWGVREMAIDALARIGTAAVDPLVSTLHDPDPHVRANAAKALSLMGPGAEKAVPALVEALRDGDDQVRANAARALGQIGEAAGPAVPALIEVLRQTSYDEDPA